MRVTIGLFFAFLISTSSFDLDISGFNNPLFSNARTEEVSQLRSELKKNPRSNEILLRLCSLYVQQKNFKKAHYYLKIAQKRGIGTPHYFYLMGQVLYEKEEYERSEKFLFHALLKSDQEYPEYFREFTKTLFQLRKFDKAAYWTSLGIKLHGPDPVLHEIYGLALIQEQRFGEAELALIKARQLSPHREDILSYNLAFLYSKLGNVKSSLYNLRRAVFSGYRDYHRLKIEDSFKGLRDNPQFHLILNEARENEMKWDYHHQFRKI